jgi:hypothetical protein
MSVELDRGRVHFSCAAERARKEKAEMLRSEGLKGPKRAEKAPGFARRRADKRRP